MQGVQATVRFRAPDGAEVALSHGDVIGRLWWVDLEIDDERVSEARALVSLRRRDLKLLVASDPPCMT